MQEHVEPIQVDPEQLADYRPLYTIATAADLLGLHPRTLRLYEQAGLMRPARKNNRRFYSNSDLEWIRVIRHLIHDQGLNQQGLRRMLAMVTHWRVMEGDPPYGEVCKARASRTEPCWEANERNGHSQDLACYKCPVYLAARVEIIEQDGDRK